METLRSVIADDEPLARGLLRSMLGAHPDVEVIGECSDGEEAVRTVLEQGPDLLFLDIQMPENDGFEVLSAVGPERMPTVIFVTAYDQYALRAFDVHALDYLLKPYDEERLARSLDRARAALRKPGRGDEARRTLALLEKLTAARDFRQRLVVRTGERVFLQPVSEVDWLEADGKHVRVHVGKQTHCIRETMIQLERELDPDRFIRISRSAIVNIDQIREIQPWFQGDHLVLMKNGARVPSTRGYRAALSRLVRP